MVLFASLITNLLTFQRFLSQHLFEFSILTFLLEFQCQIGLELTSFEMRCLNKLVKMHITLIISIKIFTRIISNFVLKGGIFFQFEAKSFPCLNLNFLQQKTPYKKDVIDFDTKPHFPNSAAKNSSFLCKLPCCNKSNNFYVEMKFRNHVSLNFLGDSFPHKIYESQKA